MSREDKYKRLREDLREGTERRLQCVTQVWWDGEAGGAFKRHSGDRTARTWWWRVR